MKNAERARLRVLGDESLGQLRRSVVERNVGARSEELGELVHQRLVGRQLPQADRFVLLALGRAAERLLGADMCDHIARRFDHEAIVQVRDSEVVHRIPVVVAKRDDGGGRLDQQIEVEQGLRRTGEGLQPHLVEALEDRGLVAVGRAMPDPVPHVSASCALNVRWVKNSSSTRSPIR